MVADSLDELHEFAKKIGVPRERYHRNASYPHYDVTDELRTMALKFGAIAGSRQQIIVCARKLKIEINTINKVRSGQMKLFADSP